VTRTTIAFVALLFIDAGCAGPANDLTYAPVSASRLGRDPNGGLPIERGRASFYSDRLVGRRTASGARYDPQALTAAHRTLPLGTVVDVATLDDRHVIVRINDRGPYVSGRVIDLSRRAAIELGMLRAGTVDVVVRVISLP
jgi:rare lipoprotein A